jgi:hypothetical protein
VWGVLDITNKHRLLFVVFNNYNAMMIMIIYFNLYNAVSKINKYNDN